MTAETYSMVGVFVPSIKKDPQARLDYSFDWTEWLAGAEDQIASHSISVDGVTLDSSAASTTIVVAWITGGVAGTVGKVTCHIRTANNREDERSIYLIVKDR